MITTDMLPGSPCWLDLGAPDVATTSAFYRAVFGWEVEPAQPAADGYATLRLDGEAVAGIGPLTEQGARSAWMIYFATPDVEAMTRAVREAGGSVRVAPLDLGGGTRMAQFTDPHGGQFAALQGGGGQGLRAVDRTGALAWTELYTTDVASAKGFYGAVLGWRTRDMPLPGGGGTYSLITPADDGQAHEFGGMTELAAADLGISGGHASWHPVFAVADCDAAAAGFTSNGGTVRMGPEDAPGVGRLAVCLDPSGADCVVLTPAPMT